MRSHCIPPRIAPQESKLALVLDRIMDLYDTAPEFQEGKTQLTGQRAAAALRVSKLIAVRCVGYLNEKRMGSLYRSGLKQ